MRMTKKFRDSLKRNTKKHKAAIVEAFGSASGCLDDLLNVDGVYFDRMVDRMCPAGLRLGGASSSDTEAPFWGLGLCVSNGAVSAEVCGGRDDFGFGKVNFPFLDGDVPRRASCGVYMSQHKVHRSFFGS